MAEGFLTYFQAHTASSFMIKDLSDYLLEVEEAKIIHYVSNVIFCT